ncbi:hypothetical protein BHE74_00031696 [Ensete ventricosum]|nr:hypothetical protein BHE74_00031696 [Ensete ventricosum]
MDTIRTGRYVAVRPLIGTRIACYRAVLPIGAVSTPGILRHTAQYQHTIPYRAELDMPV